jgi:hypothetical protein
LEQELTPADPEVVSVRVENRGGWIGYVRELAENGQLAA